MLEEADRQSQARKVIEEKKQKARMKLYVALLLDEILERTDTHGKVLSAKQALEKCFGSSFDDLCNGFESYFAQFWPRVVGEDQTALFLEVFNKELKNRSLSYELQQYNNWGIRVISPI